MSLEQSKFLTNRLTLSCGTRVCSGLSMPAGNLWMLSRRLYRLSHAGNASAPWQLSPVKCDLAQASEIRSNHNIRKSLPAINDNRHSPSRSGDGAAMSAAAGAVRSFTDPETYTATSLSGGLAPAPHRTAHTDP